MKLLRLLTRITICTISEASNFQHFESISHEEIFTSLNGEMRIYSSTMLTDKKFMALVQDRQYRLGVSRSIMGYYYQPQFSLKYSW